MAIDTAAKRASATRILIPGYQGIIPSGTVLRQPAAWIYSGISAGAVVSGLFYTIHPLGRKYHLYLLRSKYIIHHG